MIHKKAIAAIAVVLYITSFITPAAHYGQQTMFGWELFIQGAIWIFIAAATPSIEGLWIAIPWLGNAAFLACLLLLVKQRHQGSFIAAVISAVMMLCYVLNPIAVPDGVGEEWMSVSLRFGYWLWVASPAITALLLRFHSPP